MGDRYFGKILTLLSFFAALFIFSCGPEELIDNEKECVVNMDCDFGSICVENMCVDDKISLLDEDDYSETEDQDNSSNEQIDIDIANDLEVIDNPMDECPNDPDKVEPGVCGCGISDKDSDNDGSADCSDGCPNDPNKEIPGECGCGAPEGSCSEPEIFWVVGPEGGSCDTACQNHNTSCVEEELNKIDTSEKMIAIANEAGVTCNGVNNWTYDSSPGLCTNIACCNGDCVGLCAYGLNTPRTCGGFYAHYSRFCPCLKK